MSKDSRNQRKFIQNLLGEAYTGSANTVHLLNYPDDQDNPGHYDLLVHGDSDVNTSEIPKLGSYVIIRQGKQRWYPGLITNVDSDANEVEVKFMYPSGKKRNNLTLALLIQYGVQQRTLF